MNIVNAICLHHVLPDVNRVGDCECMACKSSSDSGPHVLSEEIPQKCYPQTR